MSNEGQRDSRARRPAPASTNAGRPAFLHTPRAQIAGVGFSITTFDRAVDDFVDAAGDHALRGQAVRLANAYCIALASEDDEYMKVLSGPGVNLPDGAPVSWLLRAKTRARANLRVRGPSFFVASLERGTRRSLRHFLLGGSESTAESVVKEIGRRWPGAQVVGAWSPPFGPLDEQFYRETVARVTEAQPDVLWLGLGTPKQDLAAAELVRRLDIPVVGVGAAFDFLGGSVREAPVLLQRIGLEWLFRFSREPRRLWRRYVFGNVRFAVAALTAELPYRRRSRRA